MRDVVIPTYLAASDPVLAALPQYAAAGVRLVELDGESPGSHIDLTDAAAVGALSEMVRGLPLAIHAVHSVYSRPSEEAWDISQPDESRRSAALDNHGKIVESAARLGAHHVVVHPGVRRRGEGRLDYGRASLVQLAHAARDAGTKVAVENLPPGFPGGSAAEMEYMLDGIDPEVAGLCLDTGHAMLGEDTPADYVRAMGHRILGIHWHTNDGSSDAHLIPDIRQAAWAEFFAALDEAGCEVPVTVEVDFPPMTTLDDALRSIRAALHGSRALRFP